VIHLRIDEFSTVLGGLVPDSMDCLVVSCVRRLISARSYSVISRFLEWPLCSENKLRAVLLSDGRAHIFNPHLRVLSIISN
jgi:hypothetical protein